MQAAKGKIQADNAAFNKTILLLNMFNAKNKIFSILKRKKQIKNHLIEELCSAVKNDRLEEVESLLKQGADINGHDKESQFPLAYAASNKNFQMVKFLVSQGANFWEKDKLENSGLLWAIIMGDEPIALYFLDHVDPQHIEPDLAKHLNYAFRYAARNNLINVCHALLDLGAGINALSKSGNSALMLAAQDGCYEALEMLLDAGADITQKNRSGCLAWEIAEQHHHNKAANLLRSAYERHVLDKIASLDDENDQSDHQSVQSFSL